MARTGAGVAVTTAVRACAPGLRVRLRNKCQVRLIIRLEIPMSPLQSVAADENARKDVPFLILVQDIYADKRILWHAILYGVSEPLALEPC